MLSESGRNSQGQRRPVVPPTFTSLQARLVEEINSRIRNGRMTERGLARAIAVSQPHVHNVLAGSRRLSLELMDLLLVYLRMSVYDLMELPEVLELEGRRSGALSLRKCLECSGRPPAPVISISSLPAALPRPALSPSAPAVA